MRESPAKKMAQRADHDALDDTLPLPALERMLTASEEPLNEGRQSSGGADSILLAQLHRLVELSESIDGRLGQIVDLLTEESPRRRSSGSSETG